MTYMFVSSAFAIILLFASCLILAKHYKFFEKHKFLLLFIAAVTGFAVYLYGYTFSAPAEAASGGGFVYSLRSALHAVFSTTRMFVFENDFPDMSDSVKQHQLYQLVFWAVNFYAMTILIMFILSSFGFRFIGRLQLFFSGSKNYYIFCGLNDSSVLLIRDIKKNKRDCVIVIDEQAKHDTPEMEELQKKIRIYNCILLSYPPEKLGTSNLGMPRRIFRNAVYAFMLADNSRHNIRSALMMMDAAKRNNASAEHLKLYVKADADHECGMFEKKNAQNDTKYEYTLINEADIAARQLLEAYPVHRQIEIDTGKAVSKSGIRIMIIGANEFGMEALRKSVYCAQFVGREFSALVVDEGLSEAAGFMKNRYPEMFAKYNIKLAEADIPGEEFFNILNKQLDSLDYLLVSLDDSELNLKIAAEAQRLLKRRRLGTKMVIAAHIRCSSKYLQSPGEGSANPVCYFGEPENIYNKDVIIHEQMDKMAKAINRYYNKLYGEEKDNWHELDLFTKESNRSSALHIRTKLRLLGLDYAPESSPLPAVSLENYLTPERLTNLAKLEHLRWNAFHFANGWTTWALSDTGNAKRAKDAASMRHACLVGWEELEGVTRHFSQNPSYQELDMDQIIKMGEILGFAGYKIVQGAEYE